MGALKAVVVILGLLIVGTAGMIGYELFRRSDKVVPATGTAGQPKIVMPKGATIADITSAGDRLVVRLDLGQGKTRLVLLDLGRGGQVSGTIDFEPEP